MDNRLGNYSLGTVWRTTRLRTVDVGAGRSATALWLRRLLYGRSTPGHWQKYVLSSLKVGLRVVISNGRN